MTKSFEFDAIVIGGGFSGVYQTYKLRELGFKVHAFERTKDLGGVWRNNIYPGARVDSEVPVYQLWIKECYEDFNFTERFPDWREVQRYFAHVEKKLHISKEYDFNSYVSSATFDENHGRWSLTVVGDGAGTYTCKYLSVCTGFASKKYIPPFKGIDKFKGIMHHTAEWPIERVDLTNKRVAVIGTGASGVQVIQECGPCVKHLTVFQRTPNLAIPMQQRKVDTKFENALKPIYDQLFVRTLDISIGGFEFGFDPRSALKVTPEEREAHFEYCWKNGGFYPWIGTFRDVWTNREANDMQYQFWRKKVLERLTRPEFHDKLAPPEPLTTFCGKRPSLENGYFEFFNQNNVDLVDVNTDPIIEFTEKGIRTAEHGEIELDIIVVATGFDAITGGLTQIDITGLGGEKLRDKWQDGVSTYLGVCTSGFPNMYFMYGPQAPTAFSNGPTCAQIQTDWITDAILYCEHNNLKWIGAKRESEILWAKHVNEIQDMTLISKTRNSWYTGANIPGKKVEALNYVGGIPRYLEILGLEADSGFRNFNKGV